ncbi:MAG: hypothetical protein FWD23_15555, partial [Oscillospiraceae bacterium]|nr:hypothetical protein [Oscillospiraceae bacterium]
MRVITVENYVVLLATTDNKRAENVIAEMIYGDTNISFGADNTGEENNGDTANIEEVTERPAVSVNLDGVVDIEPEILFDFDILSGIDLTAQAPPPATDPGARKTNLPRVDIRKHTHNTHFLIGGKCETGAMIRVTGGLDELYVRSNHGNFLVEIPFATEGATILRLTAETPGKEPSEEIAFIVSPRRDINYFETFGTFGVIVGYNHMTYFYDCIDHGGSASLLTNADTEIANLTTRISNRITQLRERGSNAEIIYLLAPNTARLWGEDMPARYAAEPGNITTILRRWTQGVTAGGATVIDLGDVMAAHKNDEYKIWHYTDSHWTEYGAYIAYR